MQSRLTETVHLLYRDDYMVAVDKPTALLSVPGRGLDKQDCLLRRVQEVYSEALLVHRLDMDTSGVVLFARNLEMQRQMSRLFEYRRIEKRYVALVAGSLEGTAGSVPFGLRKDMEQRLPPRHVVDCVRGKKALTHWEVLERLEGMTRVGLVPETGRSHQLRVHMQSMGHPIVGDPIYGSRGERLMLHAERLAFSHPVSGEPIVLESPAPF
jgi:tRNA pseudouridine32 synthase / 23S rRNA pseudouridine746 synthase